jgi:hypothetical protein
MSTPYPTKEEVQQVLEEVEALDLPDGAYWMMCHEMLGLEYGDLFPLMDGYGLFDDKEEANG